MVKLLSKRCIAAIKLHASHAEHAVNANCTPYFPWGVHLAITKLSTNRYFIV